jgi:uncharacterized ferritin-like protein (DUF455 family)
MAAESSAVAVAEHLRAAALRCLEIAEPLAKADATLKLDRHARVVADWVGVPAGPLPGRTERPKLVSPQQVPRRSLQVVDGRAALIHALAHIELNAVNLALDIVWRFPNQPENFYRDWIGVAIEEARHFGWLREHLVSLGYEYGAFDAHDGLWEMAAKTTDDVLARLALVARTAEARGLDVSPGLRDKLARAGDVRGAEILDHILRDEIGHVAIGSHWYNAICATRGVDPIAAQQDLVQRYGAPKVRGPLNREARRAAGFSEAELALLESAALESRPQRAEG